MVNEPACKRIKVDDVVASNDESTADLLRPIEVIYVPTKMHDGGTPLRRANTKQKVSKGGADSEPQDPKRDDPFMFYSNEANRLSTLLLRHEGNGGELIRPIERKTRISFEVHPDLLLSDMLSDMLFKAAAVRKGRPNE